MVSNAGPAWIFCPADRPERFEKAAAAADVVILDLEDVVAPDAKATARQQIVEHVPDLVDLEQARWISLTWNQIGRGATPLDALEDLGDWQARAELVRLIHVDAALDLIAERIGRTVAVPA